MLGVLVELNGLTQLAKLDQSLIGTEQRQLLTHLNLSEESFSREGNCFYFQFPYRKEESSLIWSGIQRLFRYLLSRREEYQGFLMVADKLSKLPLEEGFKRMKDMRLPMRSMDSLYLTPRASESFPVLKGIAREGDFLVLRGEERSLIVAESPGNRFAQRDKLIEGIRQRIIPRIDEEPYQGLYHFHGPRGIGKLWNLKRALGEMQKNDVPIPLFSGDPEEASPWGELLGAFDPNFLGELHHHLLPRERAAWDARSFLRPFSVADAGRSDSLIYIRLYLIAYRRACEEVMIPPFIIIRNPGLFGDEAVRILIDLLEEEQEPRLIPLIITEEPELPEPWRAFPCQRMRISPLSPGEIRDRLEDAYLKDISPEIVRDKTQGELFLLHHYILLERAESLNLKNLKGEKLSQALAGSLGTSHQKVIYALSLYPGLMDESSWVEGLDRSGLLAEEPGTVLDELFALDLVVDAGAVRLYREGLEEGCELSEGEKRALRSSLLELWSSKSEEEDSLSVARLLLAFGSDPLPQNLIRLFFDKICRILEAGRGKIVEGYLERFENLGGGGESPLSQAVLKTLYLRSALMQGDREMARVRFLAFKEIVENPLTLPEALYNLEAGRYHYSCGEYRKALEDAKKALLYIQSYEESPLLEADANCQIGLIMMGMRRLDEGVMYFGLAQDVLRGAENPHESIKTIAYEGLCHFLLGNHAKALRLARSAGEQAAAWGRREWELFALLLQGRTFFDLGEYEEAEALFIRGLNQCELFFDEGRKQIFYAWMARCRIYRGKAGHVLTVLGTLKPTCEVLYFTAEALFFMGRHERALDALNLALKNHEGRVGEFSPGEHLSWKTGFASLEDRAIKGSDGNGVLVHCVRAFRGYLLGIGEEKEEGRRELSRIIRDDKICEEDPYNHFYYYLYNQVVPVHGDTESVNRLTILSRGLKYLQLRGSRIDETKIKQAYLNRNYWNGKLMEEGRTQKIL